MKTIEFKITTKENLISEVGLKMASIVWGITQHVKTYKCIVGETKYTFTK